jgi:hypothetical protein
MEDEVTIRAILSIAMGLALVSAGGCQQQSSTIRDNFSRALSSPPTPERPKVATPKPVAKPEATSIESTKPITPEPSPAATEAAATPPVPTPPKEPAVQFAGKSENELRAMLGPPTEELKQPPGKRWLYRDGQCTLYVQLFPDIRTKEFGSLSSAVTSDDGTDEGKRVCLAQFQSRVEGRHP